MNKEECAAKIIECFPECKGVYLEHMKDFGEVLLHVFVSETINEPLVLLLNKHSDPGAYCELIEAMWRDGDDAVRNVVDVTVLERLSDDDNVWQEFGKYISKEFKEYINAELLSKNMMMAAVNPINEQGRNMSENGIESLSYLWEKEKHTHVLVKTAMGLAIIQKKPRSMLLVEDEDELLTVTRKMIEHGVPVYDSLAQIPEDD